MSRQTADALIASSQALGGSVVVVVVVVAAVGRQGGLWSLCLLAPCGEAGQGIRR